jgi:hypothetical protein
MDVDRDIYILELLAYFYFSFEYRRRHLRAQWPPNIPYQL